jgi:hypothetical protein
MHFTVLVLNDNIEEQLDPFFELEVSMNQSEIKDDPRGKFVEELTTEELENDFNRVKSEHPEYHQYKTIDDFANGYHEYYKSPYDECWGRWTNPKCKWDWYEIGGRWSGMLKIKDCPEYPDDIESKKYGYADSIRLCDIDFEGMKKLETFAIIKDGEWYEKGQMGWWGISENSDEKWQEEFDKLLKTLPKDTLLTIVDCHI